MPSVQVFFFSKITAPYFTYSTLWPTVQITILIKLRWHLLTPYNQVAVKINQWIVFPVPGGVSAGPLGPRAQGGVARPPGNVKDWVSKNIYSTYKGQG